MDGAIQKISELLELSIGLKVSSIGTSTFQRAVKSRKRALDIADDEEYLQKLTHSFMELRRLVEEVVVPETWFFRDQEPFRYLTEHVLQTTKDLSVDIFRVLSLPCSTGEEPYSIAMTMFEAGLKPASFYIDAVDVSGRSLTVARNGVYKKNSFRTKDISFRDRFFHKTDDGYSLNSMVREKVRFVRGNILQPGFLESLGRYDVVFCRNLLIYFDRKAQEKAINGLYKLLMPKGLLFTGHSEASLFMGGSFSPVAHSRAFAFQKRDVVPEIMQPLKKDSILGNSTASGIPATPRFRPSLSQTTMKVKVARLKTDEASFDRVRKMADSGSLEEAADLCEKYLRRNGPSAEWYYLLGVIRDSQGRAEEAFRFFRKAVYLDPENAESLIQLALLAERAGNIDTAENYRRRARRIQEKELE